MTFKAGGVLKPLEAQVLSNRIMYATTTSKKTMLGRIL